MNTFFFLNEDSQILVERYHKLTWLGHESIMSIIFFIPQPNPESSQLNFYKHPIPTKKKETQEWRNSAYYYYLNYSFSSPLHSLVLNIKNKPFSILKPLSSILLLLLLHQKANVFFCLNHGILARIVATGRESIVVLALVQGLWLPFIWTTLLTSCRGSTRCWLPTSWHRSFILEAWRISTCQKTKYKENCQVTALLIWPNWFLLIWGRMTSLAPFPLSFFSWDIFNILIWVATISMIFLKR